MPRNLSPTAHPWAVAFITTSLGGLLADAQTEMSLDNADFISPTQSAAESAARQADADDRFRAILAPQQGDDLAVGNGNQAANSPEAMPSELPSVVPSPATATTASCGDERTVEMPLDDFISLRKQRADKWEVESLPMGPNVTLGASEFTGRAVKDALVLSLKLQITLGNNDEWKSVPIIGDDVVLIEASADGETLPVTRLNGYLVWPTTRSGELTVSVDFMVPSRGPRGSLEYDFLIARTPVTRFSCRFPVSGLEPRLAAAQEAKVTSDNGDSVLEATLKPTTRIHLVGYKDIGDDKEEAARVFAESMSLLSVEEGAFDVFAVIRYTILYAGAKRFDVRIPEGMTVESADGEGAFHFTVENSDRGQILRGETAFPIRNNYEISMRLRRKTAAYGEVLSVPLPRPLGVEREHGWLAVEVLGKLKVEEHTAVDITALDVRQLPPEMVKSAVSPIVRAYRYHAPTAAVELSVERLPEQEPASASVDRIRAFTVVSEEGKMLTDMRIRLRNRLRPNLALVVPPDVEILSVHLDGEAVRPSRDNDGRLILPLKRSAGGENLEQITLQTVMESRVSSFDLAGVKHLALPAVDLPASSTEWTVYLPAKNVYSRLEGDVADQVYFNEANWFTSPFSSAPVRQVQQAVSPGSAAPDSETAATGAGVVSVRIELPKSGTRLDHARYWMAENNPIGVSFYYVRSWLVIPAAILFTVILAVGFALLNAVWSKRRSRVRPIAGMVLVVAALIPLYMLAGVLAIVIGIGLGAIITVVRSGLHRTLPQNVSEWSSTLGERFKKRKRDADKLTVRRFISGVGIAFFGLLLLSALTEFAALLLNPL